MIYYLIYFVVISLVSVIITVYDKKAAKIGKRRIRESTLLLLSALGGSLAMYITMILLNISKITQSNQLKLVVIRSKFLYLLCHPYIFQILT